MEGPDQPFELESDLGRTVARLVSLVTLVGVLGLLGTLGWLFVIYPDSDGPEGHDDDNLTRLARYVVEVREHIDHQSPDGIMGGAVDFPEFD